MMQWQTLRNYWHTIRYLKLVQIVGRLRHKFRKIHPNLKPPPATRLLSNSWVKSARRRQLLLALDELKVLNHSVQNPWCRAPASEARWVLVQREGTVLTNLISVDSDRLLFI